LTEKRRIEDVEVVGASWSKENDAILPGEHANDH